MRFTSCVEIAGRGRDGTGTAIIPATTPATIEVISAARQAVPPGTIRCAATAATVPHTDVATHRPIAAVPTVVPVTGAGPTAHAMIAVAPTPAEATVADRTARVKIGAVQTASPATAAVRMAPRATVPIQTQARSAPAPTASLKSAAKIFPRKTEQRDAHILSPQP